MTYRSPVDPYRTDTEWQRWGEQDPYFGVITDPRFRQQNLTPEVLADFFKTGRSHVAHILQVCQRQLSSKFAPERALDFGCGVGRIVVGMAERLPQVVGVDIAPAMLAEARKNCEARGLGNVTLVPSDDALSAVEGTFDLIHTVLVLQHIHPSRGHAIVSRLFERLNPGGIAALHVTYAKAQFADQYGQPPTAAPAPSSRWGLKWRARRATSVAAPDADPEMQMYPYPLNPIMFSAQRAGAKRCFIEFTDHGGEWGLLFYALREVK